MGFFYLHSAITLSTMRCVMVIREGLPHKCEKSEAIEASLRGAGPHPMRNRETSLRGETNKEPTKRTVAQGKEGII